VVAVPNLALQRTAGSTTVKLATGESVDVETGVTDGRNTEIISGLQEGQSIVSMNVTITPTAANANGAQQLLRAGGLGGGGAGGGFGGGAGGGRAVTGRGG